MSAVEINFDGLIGPTHNYSGLSEGNLASANNQGMVSRPRDGALQGLAKMRRLMALGLSQGVLPPQQRPNITWLRNLGFTGSDARVWESAWKSEPGLARNALAASSMWAANAATVSPSADCADGRLHLSVANLSTMLHRAQEAPDTLRALRKLMADESRFSVHAPLPSHAAFSDEGGANHMRLASAPGAPGLEIFIYGRTAADARAGFPARQTLEAGRAIARRHGLAPERVIFARQAPAAIDAGAFHNDVVAVSHDNVLFHHGEAFADKAALYAEIREKARGLFEPVFVEIPASQVSLADAVSSYLFNSQLVRTPGASSLTLIAPSEVRENNKTGPLVAERVSRQGAVIGAVDYVEVRESMRNGGGPACLRLRIVMNEAERKAAHSGLFLDASLSDTIETWIRKHYREELAPADLGDPALIDESKAALDALTEILGLGPDFYDFQRG